MASIHRGEPTLYSRALVCRRGRRRPSALQLPASKFASRLGALQPLGRGVAPVYTRVSGLYGRASPTTRLLPASSCYQLPFVGRAGIVPTSASLPARKSVFNHLDLHIWPRAPLRTTRSWLGRLPLLLRDCALTGVARHTPWHHFGPGCSRLPVPRCSPPADARTPRRWPKSNSVARRFLNPWISSLDHCSPSDGAGSRRGSACCCNRDDRARAVHTRRRSKPRTAHPPPVWTVRLRGRGSRRATPRFADSSSPTVARSRHPRRCCSGELRSIGGGSPRAGAAQRGRRRGHRAARAGLGARGGAPLA